MTDNDEAIGSISSSQVEDDDGFVFVRKSGSIISREPYKPKSTVEPIIEDDDDHNDQRIEEQDDIKELRTVNRLTKSSREKKESVLHRNGSISSTLNRNTRTVIEERSPKTLRDEKKKAGTTQTALASSRNRKQALTIEGPHLKTFKGKRQIDDLEESPLQDENNEAERNISPPLNRGKKRQTTLAQKSKPNRASKKLRKDTDPADVKASDELLLATPARRKCSALAKTKVDNKEPPKISKRQNEDSTATLNGTSKRRVNQEAPKQNLRQTRSQMKSMTDQAIDNDTKDNPQEEVSDEKELIILDPESDSEDEELKLMSSTKFAFPTTSRKRIKKPIENEFSKEPTPEPSLHEEDVDIIDEIESPPMSPRLQEDAINTPPRLTEAEENSLDDQEEPSHTTKITLPISDTPIIRKNQAMRRRISNSRRSSLGNRGKRASSIGNGFTAVPHSEVEPENFYKHLDHEAPDPHRMKQLLVWSSRRILELQSEQYNKLKNSPDLNTEERTALRIARVIQEEIVQDLSDGKISTSWWNRPTEDEAEDTLKTTSDAPKKYKPNALNIANRENLAIYRKRIQELRQEKERWLAQIERVKLAAEGFKNFVAMTEQASNPDSSSKEGLTQALKRIAPEEFEQVVSKYPVVEAGLGSSEIAAEKAISAADASVQKMTRSVDVFGDFAQKVQAVAKASSAFSRGAIRDISLQLQREDEAVRYAKQHQQKQQRLQESLKGGATTEGESVLLDSGEERNLGSSNGSSVASDDDSDEEGFGKIGISPETTALAAHVQDSSLASVIFKSAQTKKILEETAATTDVDDGMIMTTNKGPDDPLLSIQANEPHVRSILRTITRLEHVQSP